MAAAIKTLQNPPPPSMCGYATVAVMQSGINDAARCALAATAHNTTGGSPLDLEQAGVPPRDTRLGSGEAGSRGTGPRCILGKETQSLANALQMWQREMDGEREREMDRERKIDREA